MGAILPGYLLMLLIVVFGVPILVLGIPYVLSKRVKPAWKKR